MDSGAPLPILRATSIGLPNEWDITGQHYIPWNRRDVRVGRTGIILGGGIPGAGKDAAGMRKTRGSLDLAPPG